MTLSRDFRTRDEDDFKAFVEAKHTPGREAAMREHVMGETDAERDAASARLVEMSRGKLWVQGAKLPEDRPGLFAMIHITAYTDEEIPAQVAIAAKREVWVITTGAGWVLWGFTIDEVPYQAADEYCGTYSPDGTYTLVGAS